MSVQSFGQQYGGQASAIQTATGFPAALLLAISYNEGADSPGTIAASNGAFFGVKSSASQPSGDAGTVTVPTNEVIGGRNTTVTSTFNAYSNFAAAAQGFIQFLQTNSRYAPTLSAVSTGAGVSQIAGDLQSAGYATDPSWGSKITSLASQFAGLVTGGGAASDPSTWPTIGSTGSTGNNGSSAAGASGSGSSSGTPSGTSGAAASSTAANPNLGGAIFGTGVSIGLWILFLVLLVLGIVALISSTKAGQEVEKGAAMAAVAA